MNKTKLLIKRLQRNNKQRERYFMKRYGSLARMFSIDEKKQDNLDELSYNLMVEEEEYLEHEFDHIKEAWCLDTCYPPLKRKWREEEPYIGQCAVTALLVDDEIDGGWIAYDEILDHYFNYDYGCHVIDLTRKQFKKGIIPEQHRTVSREELLLNADTKRRYKILKKRAGKNKKNTTVDN